MLREFDFEHHARMVWSLLIAPFVLSLVALADLAVLAIDGNRLGSLGLFTLFHFIEVLEHTLLFALPFSFLLFRNLFLVRAAPPRSIVRIRIRASVLFFEHLLLNALPRFHHQLFLHLWQHLLSLEPP